MKKSFLSLLLLCVLVFSYSQENKDKLHPDFLSLIKERPKNYFKVKDYFYKRGGLENEKQLQLFLQECDAKNYTLGKCYAYNTLGYYKRKENKEKESLEFYKKALALAKEINNKESQILTSNMLGYYYRSKEYPQNALDYYQSALNLIAEIKTPSQNILKSESIAENGIGNIYLRLKQYRLAIEKFSKALKIQKIIKNTKGIAINYQNLGIANENLGYLDKALQYYKNSHKYNDIVKNELGTVITRNSIGGVLIKQGKYKESLDIIEPLLTKAVKLNNKQYLTLTYNNLGCAQLHNEQFDNAEYNLTQALTIATENKNNYGIIDSYKHLSELYEKKQDYEKSLNFYKKSKDIEEQLFNEKSFKYIKNLINKHELEKLDDIKERVKVANLELDRNKNILIITIVTLALLSVVLYSIYRHNILQNDRKVLMVKQDALQSQMNPHFIFNALNSIKLYIINNEQKNAVRYLNKFSKLIRQILEASKIKETSLESELATMNLYMSIENIRFNNEIKYIEEVEDNLNLETIKIPPLVLQPFIENAIWHGLSSKESEKQIKISVLKTDDEMIQINIEDNGIGRKAATNIKKGKSLNRKSIGVNLTKERLDNFVLKFDRDYSLKYVDLYDDAKNPDGTRVEIKIPLV